MKIIHKKMIMLYIRNLGNAKWGWPVSFQLNMFTSLFIWKFHGFVRKIRENYINKPFWVTYNIFKLYVLTSSKFYFQDM